MGRKVKCHFCKSELDIDKAYKVIEYDTNDKPKNYYYCSREEYEKYEFERKKQADAKNKAYSLICNIIGRPQIINTVLWKEWKTWGTVASNEVIAQYLEENKSYLTGVIARLEDKEFNRIRYLSAILKNHLGDYKPKTVEVKKETSIVQEEYYETKFKQKERKGLIDFEEEYDEF